MAAGPHEEPEGRPLGRRAFLGLVGVGLSSLVWGDGVLRAVSGGFESATSALPLQLRNALPALDGGWRIYAVNPPYPRFEPRTWRLRVDGLVDRPLDLTYADLQALPRSEQVVDFHCVTGWSAP